MKNIGSTIKNRRNELNIGQRELARRIGATNPAIMKIEKNLSSPRKPTLEAICRELDLNPETLEPLPYPYNAVGASIIVMFPCFGWHVSFLRTLGGLVGLGTKVKVEEGALFGEIFAEYRADADEALFTIEDKVLYFTYELELISNFAADGFSLNQVHKFARDMRLSQNRLFYLNGHYECSVQYDDIIAELKKWGET